MEMIPLNNYKYDALLPILNSALIGEIKLFVISTSSGELTALNKGHIQTIMATNPDRVVIAIDAIDGCFYPKNMVAQARLSTGEAQYIGIIDLWIQRSDFIGFDLMDDREDLLSEIDRLRKENDLLTANEDLEVSVSDRSEKTYLNIIGVMLSAFLAKSKNGDNMSIFADQAALINYFLNHHSELQGISKRTLEKKFAKAKEQIKN